MRKIDWFMYIVALSSLEVNSYEWTADSVHRRPQLDRRAIAGIWRLTPVPAVTIPMKEFTVYPKKQIKKQSIFDDNGFLLMLREDGSFQQYALANDDDDDDEVEMDGTDLTKSWTQFVSRRKNKQKEESGGQLLDFVKGIWDYRNGKLILAADRPEITKRQFYDEPQSRSTSVSTKESQDTLLEGEVVATYQVPLVENPVLVDKPSLSSALAESSSDTSTGKGNALVRNTTKGSFDTHLSVPKGSIKTGKFFYPKKHPSFFEQPMFQPVKKGSFALRQVLGSLNTAQSQAENENALKFQRSNFYNKTFFLTTHPIGYRLPKGPWSPKYNSFGDSTSSKRAEVAADNGSVGNIRVMQVKFYANNTFSSTGGLGSDVILRGRYDVIGELMDHLWFQVVRFGFGRSVSGSVYSEGRMLSHNDAKSYWGKITTSEEPGIRKDATDEPSIANTTTYLEVIGSVLDGWGLEPIPVARFIMRENRESDHDLVAEDDEEEDDIDDSVCHNFDLDVVTGSSEIDGIDWSNREDSDSFQ